MKPPAAETTEHNHPLRVGLVGCGSISRAHAVALRFLAEDGLVEPVAIADPDPAGIERVQPILGEVKHVMADGGALVSHPDVEAVVLTAPTRFHRQYVDAVAAAEKPLFSEKPLAPSYQAAREIVAVVEGAGIDAQVGFQSRYHPLYRHLHGLIEGGGDGSVMGYSLRDDQFWPTAAVVPGHTTWRSQRSEAGGGALLEHSIHACDLVSWLFGPVRRVYASTRAVYGFDVEDVAALVLEHESGVVGTLLTVFNGVRHREERRLDVFLEGASIEVTTDFVVGAPEDSFLIHRGTEVHAERLDPAAVRRQAWLAEGLDPDREVFVYQYLAHRSFALALSRGEAPTPTMQDALRAHQVVEAGYRSAAGGLPVETASLEA